MTCPLCLLAVAVACALICVAFGAIVLDRVRSLQQAEFSGRKIAEVAAGRAGAVLSAADMALQMVATASEPMDAGRAARVDAVLTAARRADPLLAALYLLDPVGGMTAGAGAVDLRIGVAAPSCLRDDRLEAGQTVMRAALIARIGTTAPVRVVCVLRGLPHGMALAVIGSDEFDAEFADIILGAHSGVALLSDAGQRIAGIGAASLPGLGAGTQGGAAQGGAVQGGATQGGAVQGGEAEQATIWQMLNRGGVAESGAGLIETRRVVAPIRATLVVSLAPADVLAAWSARAGLLGSSALIVIAFIALAVLAIRRAELRDAVRLDRVATLAGDLRDVPDRAQLMRLLVEAVCDLVPSDLLAEGEATSELAPTRPIGLTILGADTLRIGGVVLRRQRGASFSPGDLACIRALVAAAQSGIGHTAAMQTYGGELQRLRGELEAARHDAATVQIEMTEASIVLDEGWRIIAANRNAAALFGEHADDLVGQVIWDAFPELAATPFEGECRRALRDAHAAGIEFDWLRSGARLAARAYPRGRGLALYLRDLGGRVAAEDQQRLGAKMEAIGRLTGGIAHDFNNLLTVVLGNIETLELELPEDGPGNADIREMHDQIRRAAETAAELTRQLLAFARRQPLSPADTDIGRLLQGLDGLLRHTLGTAYRLELRSQAGLWQARVDALQLESAILNVVTNAREAMPQGGRLTIEAANLVIRKPDSDAFGEIRPGSYVVISLTDTGRGIAREVMDKLFDPFFTTKPAGRGRGTGLGLSMVYGFVGQSGGHVRVASEPGRGTTVRLYIPAIGTTVIEAPVRGRGRRALPGGRETILVVEDAPMVRDYATGVLTDLGYAVVAAADGRAALALIEDGLSPALLLTDVLLPDGLDGVALSDRIVKLRPRITVMFMSGYVENQTAFEGRLDPTSNLLLKPFTRQALAAMVRRRLDSGVSESSAREQCGKVT